MYRPAQNQLSPPLPRAAGFTLIELLVVASLIALLITILFPVLGTARDTTRMTQCLVNQKNLMTGWSGALADNREEIPHIVPDNLPFNAPENANWWGLLADQYTGIQKLLSSQPADPSNPYLCPVIDSEFDRPSYRSKYFGVSVNSRWSDCGDVGENELRPWSQIKRMSEYPWFADPHVFSFSLADSVFGKPTAPNFGLGFYHRGDTGNVAFADGHVESIQSDVLEEKGPCGTPKWMLAELP